ncbi:MAG: patatin-like phospholipase family protein [Waddliaceae bacterium]
MGELEKAGELDHLEQIVGSSTGAVTGLFLASGLTPEEIGKLVDELKKDDVTGKCKDFEKKYPGLLELRGTGFSATKALRLADKKTALSVRSYLNRNWETIEEKHKDGTIKEDEYNRLQELRRQTSGKHPPRSTQMITFKDLAILHRVAPTQFKELTITGWDKTKRELIYFNKETTPGMPIALAGRISMAMPPIFKAVVYDPKDGKGVREFCDGGIGSNVPLGGVHGKEKGSKKKALAHTMVLAFDGFGKAQKRMEGTQSKTDKLFGRFRDKLAGRLLLGNPEYHKTTETDRENIHQLHRYRNVFVVGHGEMGTRDFDASDKMRAAAKEDAAKRAVEQIDKRKKRFLRKDFKDMDAVYEALTEDEKAAILASPPPLPKVGDPTSELEYELYQLVESKKRS